jgi:methylmalonyl-CoA mutase
MDPEYTVMGRVARRIWAVAMRDVRRERAQPEAQVPLPDQRALAARAGDPVQRHPHHAAGADRHLRQRNSLHTNAFDEAITTPTEDSVRRAMAIQLIINREWGLAKNENPLQGSVHRR